MKTLYLDIFSGMSGDMFVGALIDLGVEEGRLEQGLASLNLEGYCLSVSRQERGAIAGTKFDVQLESNAPSATEKQQQDHHHQHHHDQSHSHSHSHSHGPSHDHGHGHGHGRNFSDIKAMIEAAPLSEWVKERAIAVFRRVAVAEGRIHGHPPEEVHFHEVGAVDSIVDIVAGCLALESLGKPRVLAGPVMEGTGMVHCAHGQFPLPAPATLEILSARSIQVRQCEEPHELLTPTGAALLAEFAESFGPLANLTVERIGYGLGSRQNKTRPNVLRAVLGTANESDAHDWETDKVAVLEANLDDINPEILGGFMKKALAAGALDVYYTPIQMKKNRPGILLSVLCSAGEAARFTELMLRETTTFGVRSSVCERRKLRRDILTVHTLYGNAVVKVGRLDGKVVQVSPEYEVCQKLADEAGVPLKMVYEAVAQAVEFP